jgi:hypothetical protein
VSNNRESYKERLRIPLLSWPESVPFILYRGFSQIKHPFHDTNPHPWIFSAHPAKGKNVEGKGSIRIPVATAGEIRHDRSMVTIVPCHFQERERHLLPNNPDLAWKELGS